MRRGAEGSGERGRAKRSAERGAEWLRRDAEGCREAPKDCRGKDIEGRGGTHMGVEKLQRDSGRRRGAEER